ncbi:MAG TPA: AraC family transcriptional regulator [Bacteroidia bacterium]|jgi:AraC-like DNA-binding protein|nr:AraC family transcriptional regulator [Bacteroidia bacterium]
MKALPFRIPIHGENSVIVEEEIEQHFYTYLHQHQEIQLTWILKGEGTLLAGNYTGHFGSGDIYWFGPNQPHVFRCDPIYFTNKNWLKAQSISVYFDVSEKNQILANLPELEQLKTFAVRSVQGFRIEPEDYVAMTEAFLRIRVKSGMQRLTAFLQLIDQVLNHSKHLPLSDEPVGHDLTEKEGSRMHSIYDFTLKNFSKDVSVGNAAEVVHMTPEAFCRFFKKHTRKTYVTFLNEVRVEQACRRLKSADDKLIAEIAYACGFGNVSHFNRVFRKVTGKTPREYQAHAAARERVR